MSSPYTTAVVISIFGEVPPPFNPNDYNMSNDEDVEEIENLNADEEETHDEDEEEIHDQNQEETQDLNADEEETHDYDQGETHDNIEEENEEHDQIIDEGPQVGMMYETREHVRQAYKEFSRSKGFGVAVRNCRPGYVIFGCDKGRSGHEAKKSTKRVNCQAHIIAYTDKESGYWRVRKVELSHNHELDPGMSPFMAGHREMTFGQKRQLEKTDISGVPVCKNIRMLQAVAGGPGNLGCSIRYCGNYIDERRRLRLGDGDVSAIQNLFLSLQQKDPNFFHLMDIDDDGRLRNVMWIHPRSRAAYEDFHDVVSFDTTYLVNRYQMPFATVVGINQHHISLSY